MSQQMGLCVFRREVQLPEGYLPLEFEGKSMLNYDTSWQNQNIYYATDANGDHIYYLD